MEEVPPSGALDADARVTDADVAVSRVGEQHRVAEQPGDATGVYVRRRRVEGGANDEDWIPSTSGPRSRVAVGARARPRGAWGPQPPTEKRAADATDPGEPMDDARPGRRPLPSRGVGAVDRLRGHEGGPDPFLGASRLGRESRTVPLDSRLEVPGEARPCRRRAEWRVEGGQKLPVVEPAPRCRRWRRDRLTTNPPQELRDTPHHRLTVARQRATGWAGPLAELLELLEPQVGRREVVGEPWLDAGDGWDRVDGAVENHCPHSPREHVRVGLTDEGPIRPAEVGEPALAEKLAQVVEIASGVGGGDVAEQRAAALGAAMCVRDGLAAVAARRCRRGRDEHPPPEPRLRLLVTKAADMCALPDTPGIPAHDVEPPAAHRIELGTVRAHVVHPGDPWAPGVEEQRSDPLLGLAGQMPDHGEPDRRPVRAVRVDGTRTRAHCSRLPQPCQAMRSLTPDAC